MSGPTEGTPPADEISPEEGRELMQEAIAEFYALDESGASSEAIVEVMGWMLEHAQWLPEEVVFDGLLLLYIRQLLLLQDKEAVLHARTYLDLEIVSADPLMRAEHALHEVALAQLEGDSAGLYAAAQAAVEAVRQSPEEQHHEMMRLILGALGSSFADAGSGTRERATSDLGPGPEARANEDYFHAMARVQQGSTSEAYEAELVSQARLHFDRDMIPTAAALLLMAVQTAVHRRDQQRALELVEAARQVLCSRQSTSGGAARVLVDTQYAGMLWAAGRRRLARQVLDSLAGNPEAASSDLLGGQVHQLRAVVLLDTDAWGALVASLTAQAALSRARDALPTAGQRHELDAMVLFAGDLAARAAARVDDPAVQAEVLEHVRAQGHPQPTGGNESPAPLWMLLDDLGVPHTRPAWMTEHEQEPALLTGPRPRARMPWGESPVTPVLSSLRDGQMVDIQVPR